MPPALQRPASLPVTDRLALTKREAARAVGVSERFLELEATAGRLRIRKAGRRVLITPADLQAWLDNRVAK